MEQNMNSTVTATSLKEGDQMPRSQRVRRITAKNRRRLFAVIAVSLAFALAGTILELGLRLAHVSYPSYYTPDPHVASRLRPGTRGWWTKEGHAWFEVNSLGMRDQPRTIEKPAGVYRIAVLGDSYMEAAQVSLQQSFTQQLQHNLNGLKCIEGRQIEVLNFGVSGYGTAQELQMLKHHVWQFQPDEVMLAFLPSNDVRDNCKALATDTCRPFFHLVNDQLVLDSSFQDLPVYRTAISRSDQWKTEIVNRSAGLQFLRQLWQQINYGRPDAISRQDAKETMRDFVQGSPYLFLPPQDEQTIEAWSITEALLDAFALQCEQQDKPLSILIVSSAIEVYPDAEFREELAKEFGLTDFHYATNRVAAWADRNEVPCWPIGTQLRDPVTQQKIYLHGFAQTGFGTGHWNADGHRLAAEWVADQWCRMQKTPTHKNP